MRKLTFSLLAMAMYLPAATAASGIGRALPSSVAPSVAPSADAATIADAKSVSRGTATRSAPTVTTTTKPGVASRSLASATAATPQTTREKLDAAVNTVGRNTRTSAASLNSNPAMRRAGVVVRPSTAEVGGRATIGNSDVQTGSNIVDAVRSVSSRAASVVSRTDDANRETIAQATERLEQTAALNKSCQQQYNDCMDQFCAVIDANQKRCSCSANLSKYTRVEQAVKNANTQLNEVAQRIRYVGLSADEIRAIMNATEAEEELSGQRDTTETRDMLSEIEDLIKDPTSSTYVSNDTFTGLDLDLDFSSNAADIFSLDFLNNTSGSFSNLRGADLYNAAKKRCNSILTQCKEVGATSQQITGNYDLAIDKDCIAYEQGLTKMNETLVSNVRSANLMLQKARLAVLQNKNQYDARGCIAALETCMTDEMVCGADYSKCLDPTKRYIDENGTVILGQDVTNIIDFMDQYNNARITTDFLTSAYDMTIDPENCSRDTSAGTGTDGAVLVGDNGACIASYLLKKIGTKQKVTDEGLCRAVLDKCQSYTYDSAGNYKSNNDIVVNYVQRAMVNIKASQHRIISDYASECMTDIASCYNQQVSQVNTWSSSASVSSIHRVMRGACRNVALTCAYAVFANDQKSCPTTGTDANPDTCIENISEMFYQSLLCPDNSEYSATELTVDENNTPGGNVNKHCRCRTGYSVFGTSCLIDCADGATRNSNGICICPGGQTQNSNGQCPAETPDSEETPDE